MAALRFASRRWNAATGGPRCFPQRAQVTALGRALKPPAPPPIAVPASAAEPTPASRARAYRLGSPAGLATTLAGPRPTQRMLRGGPTGASGTPFATRPDRVVRLKFLSVIERLRALSVRRTPGVEETTHFPLPKGLGDKAMGLADWCLRG